MKYVVIIGDGMADRPLNELGGKTPLQEAFTPNMDKLACEGIIGRVRTIPEGFHPGSDVANLSVLGYDPRKFYTGRASLEAASIGVELKETDVAYRCNLITLKFNKDKTQAVMEDYSGGHISTEEAGILINAECTPPHDIIGRDISGYLPIGSGEETLRELMLDSVDVLESHYINKERINKGKNPANSIWLWGQGKKPGLSRFREKYSVEGAMVSAVDLTKGLGIYAGFEILQVPGVTGWLDTNYVGKAEAALTALKEVDFVYIHVEAPDEAGHSGNYKNKIKAIEDFDALVVGTVMRGIKSFEEFRILLMPDHPTPVELRTHTDEPVPFVIYDNKQKQKNEGAAFDESILKRKNIMVFEEGYKLMDYFIKGVK